MKRFQTYISGPLSSSPNPEEAYRLYDGTAELSRKYGLTPYVPHKNNLQPGGNFNRDELLTIYKGCKKAVMRSKLVIAHVDTPSHGVGVELEIANMYGVPFICLVKEDVHLSEMVEGMVYDAQDNWDFEDRPSMFSLIKYKDEEDYFQKLEEDLKRRGFVSE